MIIIGATYNATSHRYEWDDGSTGILENLTFSEDRACVLVTDAMEMTACEMQPI